MNSVRSEQAEEGVQSWKERVQRTKWIAPALLGVDFLIWGTGSILPFFVHVDPVVSFVLGLIGIGLNHWFTPIVVERIRSVLFPPTNIKVGMNLEFSRKVNRHSDEK